MARLFMFLAFVATFLIAPVAEAADMKSEIARAHELAMLNRAGLSSLKVEVDFGTCQQLPDTYGRNDDPHLLIPEEKREAFALAQIESCEKRFKIKIQDDYDAWKARQAAAAAPTPTPTTSNGRRQVVVVEPATENETATVVVALEEYSWTQKGLVLSVGAGAGAMRITGHETGTPRLTSFLASTSVEARYSFGFTGIGARATILPDLGGGMAFAGHFVPSMYVDESRAYVRVEPLLGYSVQKMGEHYVEDRVELGLSVIGRFARNWGVRGTAIYGIDPDIANKPDNAGRFALEFVGEFATSR